MVRLLGRALDSRRARGIAVVAIEACPCCESEPAEVLLSTEVGEVRVGPRCSRLLEQLIRLAGARTIRKRRVPVLRRIK